MAVIAVFNFSHVVSSKFVGNVGLALRKQAKEMWIQQSQTAQERGESHFYF